MCRRLNFIVEGQTEERFVNNVLRDYLAGLSIYASAHLRIQPRLGASLRRPRDSPQNSSTTDRRRRRRSGSRPRYRNTRGGRHLPAQSLPPTSACLRSNRGAAIFGSGLSGLRLAVLHQHDR